MNSFQSWSSRVKLFLILGSQVFKTVVKYEMFIALGARDSVIPLESHFNKKHEK